MAQVPFVVLGIRGNGRMTYNLAKPNVLPASVCFDGGVEKLPMRQFSLSAEAFDPASILLQPFSLPEILSPIRPGTAQHPAFWAPS